MAAMLLARMGIIRGRLSEFRFDPGWLEPGSPVQIKEEISANKELLNRLDSYSMFQGPLTELVKDSQFDKCGWLGIRCLGNT